MYNSAYHKDTEESHQTEGRKNLPYSTLHTYSVAVDVTSYAIFNFAHSFPCSICIHCTSCFLVALQSLSQAIENEMHIKQKYTQFACTTVYTISICNHIQLYRTATYQIPYATLCETTNKFLSLLIYAGTCDHILSITPMVVPISVGGLMFLVGIATFTAGVVMLVRAKRVLHHSSQPPPPGTDHYEMVDEGEKSAPLGAVVYEEIDKQDTQTDGHTKHYQELDLAKMERREYATIKV